MTLEQQVVSLELAKKLKELGVKQESLFWWYERKNQRNEGTNWQVSNNADHRIWPEDFLTVASAFTVAELGEMLHEPLRSSDDMMNMYYPNCFITYFKEPDKHWVIGDKYPLAKAQWIDYGTTEADARAKMLIYLVENKLIQLQ
ncbi:MAG: hypothetical protein ACLGJB_17695 [Blastocatellia bacterium]